MPTSIYSPPTRLPYPHSVGEESREVAELAECLYTVSLKKYARPEDLRLPERLNCLRGNHDVQVTVTVTVGPGLALSLPLSLLFVFDNDC